MGQSDRIDLNALLSTGGVHVVCFADEHATDPASLLATGAGLDPTERRLFCDRVNADDATGCLWPIARLSALPARFAGRSQEDAEGLRRCLLRVFELNATLCKCSLLVLDLRQATRQGAARVADAAMRLQAEIGDTSGVAELRMLQDPAGWA